MARPKCCLLPPDSGVFTLALIHDPAMPEDGGPLSAYFDDIITGPNGIEATHPYATTTGDCDEPRLDVVIAIVTRHE